MAIDSPRTKKNVNKNPSSQHIKIIFSLSPHSWLLLFVSGDYFVFRTLNYSLKLLVGFVLQLRQANSLHVQFFPSEILAPLPD